MIAIIDSGSTKSDWLIVDSEGMEQFRTKTIGMNPYFVSSEDIADEISKNQDLMKQASMISHIFFYGAGCSTSEYNKVLEKGLAQIFKKSKIRIEHDLLAAAYSAYRNRPAIVCILGTGSNSCYFDGRKLYEETPSLAFILGDEGSGSNLGKRIIRSYFLKKMPKRLSRTFKERFNLTLKELNKNVYDNKFANAYLASFSRFVIDYKHEPFIQKIIYDSLNEFMINQVLVYPQAKSVELNFIGSIAHFYEDTLAAVASEYHLKIGEIIKNPIDNLVRYHAIHIIPKLKPLKDSEPQGASQESKASG
ncbi:ATPase [Bacteroidetes bacterium endosymbiont of Geopemphigus sp.]|uniref:ATPase n=1 Tax=Bacteroidetes bacterium endosymbiont of Geopemphigus sp. TaxID=2047937 RepID=UPI0018A807C0|nr:ATPase [Bacteroidetes bacterium endosymbiont of Geopemphigus sp.]